MPVTSAAPSRVIAISYTGIDSLPVDLSSIVKVNAGTAKPNEWEPRILLTVSAGKRWVLK
ncbi:hypothetical protein D3C77_410120 [compost metagenome]